MIATVRVKDLIKYLVMLILSICFVVFITRFFLRKNSDIGFKNLDLIKNNNNFLSCLNVSLTFSKISKKDDNVSDYSDKKITKINRNKKSTSRGLLKRLLDIELPKVEKIEDNEEENLGDVENETNQLEDFKKVERIQIKDTYTNQYKSVKIKNLTNIKLTEDILKPDYNVNNKRDIIIYHTHTCESYTQTDKNKYKPSGNYRTTNLKYSVAKVGDELEKQLKKKKFNVIHDKTKHDYPAYTGSYSRSLKTVEKILENQKDTEIIFDLHRDAVGNKGGYAPTVEIKGEKVAQIMFVIGTNDGGGKHPNWKNNLKFAVAVQEKGNEMYPGLFRAINLRSATFNQKVSNAASIIEVGATGNTLEEATASMKYLAKVLNKVLK